MSYENEYAHREQGRWGGPFERRAFPPDVPIERRLGYERFSPPPPGPPRGRFSPPPPPGGLRRYSPPRRSRFSPPPPRRDDFYPPPRRVQEEYPPQERFREQDRYPPPKKQKTFHPPKEQVKDFRQQQGPKESPKYQKKFDQDSDSQKNEQVKESPKQPQPASKFQQSPKQAAPQQPKPPEQSPKQPATPQNKPPLPKESPKPPLPQQSPKPPTPAQTQKPPLPQQSPKPTISQQSPKAPLQQKTTPTPAASKPTPSPQNKPQQQQQRVANSPRFQQNAKQQHISKFQQDPKFQQDQQFQEDTLPIGGNSGGPVAQQVSNFGAPQEAMDTTPTQQTPQPLMSISSQNEPVQQEQQQQQQGSDADTPTQSRWGQKKAKQKQNKKARQQQQQQQQQQGWSPKQQQQQYHQQHQQGWQQERDSYREPAYNDHHQSGSQQQYNEEDEPVRDETPKPRSLVQPGPVEPHSRRVKKFSSRSRLFIGNIQGMEDHEFSDMFSQFGEIQEPYVHKEKGFGFVRMAFKAHAEAAIDALDGTVRNGRQLHVRFACSTSSVKVSNLSPYVSNELLEESFSLFGPVERAVVCTDERGRSLGYGVVDFFRKSHAQQAISRCREEFFVLTRTPIPVNVTDMMQVNEDDGLPEKNIMKQHQAQMEKSVMPRFVAPGEPEHEVCLHWKVLFDSQKKKEDELKREIDEARDAMMKESEKASKEQESFHMRQEILRQHEEHMRIAEDLRRQLDSVASYREPPDQRQYGMSGGYDNHYGRGGEQSQWVDARGGGGGGGQYGAQQGGGGGGPPAGQYNSPQQMAGAPGQYNDQQIAQLTAAAQQLQYQSQQGMYGATNSPMIKVLDYDHTGIARPLMDSGQQ